MSCSVRIIRCHYVRGKPARPRKVSSIPTEVPDWPLDRIVQLPDSCFATLKKSIDIPQTLPILTTGNNIMEIVSVKTRKLVKQKPPTFPALPDYANLELKIPPADQAGRPDQAEDLQKSDLGARAGSGLRLDIIITPTNSRKRDKWIFHTRRCHYVCV